MVKDNKNTEPDNTDKKLDISDVKNSVQSLYEKYDREMKDYFLDEIGKGLTQDEAYKKREASIKANVLKEVLEHCF